MSESTVRVSLVVRPSSGFGRTHNPDADACTTVAGESEYWFALIKVIMIVMFIIVGLIYDWGGVVHHPGPVRLYTRAS